MTDATKTNADQMAAEQNNAVRDYLNYYIDLKTPPKFAVLLTGKWGSGKSWFMNDVLKQRYGENNKVGEDYLLVSLYGMTNFADIENEFFSQMHPLLSSKGAKFAGKLVKGLLKVSVNFDANHDGKSDGSVSGGVPAESFFGSSKPGKERPIIFDDVERCSIPVPVLLGYINQLVEQGDMRVILVANEEEMLKPVKTKEKNANKGEDEEVDEAQVGLTGQDPEYQRIKEKLIGQTLRVMPMVENAFVAFYAELPDGPGKQVVTENATEIKNIYRAAELDNLRLLRYALMEFCRFAKAVNDELLKNKELARELLTEYICYAMLLRSGEFHPDELALFGTRGRFNKLAGIKDGKEEKADSWRRRLPWISHFSPLLSSTMWEAILAGGAWPIDLIHEALRNSRHFATETTPNWVQLWHGSHALNDQDFAVLLKMVIQEWDNKHYQHEGEMLHVFGMLLEFGKADLHDRNVADLVSEAQEYILHLKAQGQLVIPEDERSSWPTRDSYAQLQFHSLDNPQFTKIQQFLKTQKEIAAEESLPSRAAKLLETLQKGGDTLTFYRELSVGSHGVGVYRDQPILTLIKPAEFMRVVGELHGQDMRNVASAFKDRYRGNSEIAKLVSELKWLQNVKKLLKNLATERKGLNSARLITLVVLPVIDEAITTLDSKAVLAKPSSKPAAPRSSKKSTSSSKGLPRSKGKSH